MPPIMNDEEYGSLLTHIVLGSVDGCAVSGQPLGTTAVPAGQILDYEHTVVVVSTGAFPYNP